MPKCTRCNSWFDTWRAYNQHITDSPRHNLCNVGNNCKVDFETWTQLKNHWIRSPQHYYCRYCDDHFFGDGDLEDHNIASHVFCRSCPKLCKDELGLKDHYRQSPRHHYCAPCNRLFTSENNLHEHLNSSAHRPKDVPCPCCSAMFISLPALALHFDSGSCTSGIDRNWVNRFVLKSDPDNMITVPTEKGQLVKYIPSPASWNGREHECHLCHKSYSNLNFLKQHLASPTHQFPMYICRGLGCGQRFTVFSALMQHAGKEKCGSAALDHVHITMANMVEKMRG